MGSANHTLSIINFLINSEEPKKLTEISRTLNISASTAFRILSSLESSEWIGRDHVTKKYKVGIHLLELAMSLISKIDLRNASLPFLEQLNSKVNENVLLSARVGLERIYIEQIQSHHELQHKADLGKRLPLWLGSTGKAMLAYLQNNEIEMVIDGLKASGVSLFASGKVIDIDKLREELTRIRKQGFSISCEERVSGINSVAAPIFNHDHRVAGAISTGGPLSRFSLSIAKNHGPLVREVANRISIQLGNYSTSNKTYREKRKMEDRNEVTDWPKLDL